MSPHPICGLPNLVRRFSPAPDQGRQLASIRRFRFRSLPGERRQRIRRLHCSESMASPTPPDISRAAVPSVSTARRFLPSLSAMRETDFSIPDIQVRASIARRTVNRTLSQHPQRVQVTPNHALQRTAPRVTVAAILTWTPLVRPGSCLTLVASLCAPPSQLPRHAPPSLSLGSLGVLAPPPRT